MKRYLCLLLCLALLCLSAVPAAAASNEQSYSSALQQLNQYLLCIPGDTTNIATVASAFQQLGNYSYSQPLYYYAQTLAEIAMGNYSTAESYCYSLSLSTDFANYLLQLRTQYSAIAPLSELSAYAAARSAEARGDYNAAKNSYASCISFMDTMKRIPAVAALAGTNSNVSISNSMSTSISTAASLALSAAMQNDRVALSWNNIPGATKYSVYRCKSHVGDYSFVKDATSTSCTDSYYFENMNNTYYVVAYDMSGNQLAKSNEFKIYASNTNNNKNSNTNKNNNANQNTNNNSNSAMGGNATASGTGTGGNVKGSGNADMDIDMKQENTQIVTIIVPTTAPAPTPQWSAWSSWSTTPVSSSSSRQVETKVENEPVYVTQYNYSRWYYYNTNWAKWTHSYTEYKGSNYKSGSGQWQYKSTTEPLPKVTPIDGHQQYNGGWWNETTKQVQNGTSAVTYYRYRDRIN